VAYIEDRELLVRNHTPTSSLPSPTLQLSFSLCVHKHTYWFGKSIPGL